MRAAPNGRSVSPTTSISSRGGSSSRPHGPATTSHLESTITRLLVATKQLLEGLAKWSRGEVNEEAISAIYVKLGNDFNVACAAFAKEGISMNELLSVPSQLRVCLETCLSDTPSQVTLERHLPEVRQIIIGLLHGLREKQRLYREGVTARRAREKAAAGSGNAPGGSGGSALNGAAGPGGSQPGGLPLTPNSAGRSRDELRRFVSQAQQQQPSAAPYDGEAAGGARPRFSDGSVPSGSASATGSIGRRSASEVGTAGDPRLSAALSSRMSGAQRGGSLREHRSASGDTNGSKRSSRATLEDVGFMPPSSTTSGAPDLPRSSSSASIDSINSSSARPSSAQSQSYPHAGGSRTPRMQSPPPPQQRNSVEPPVPRTPTMDSFGITTAPPASAVPSAVVRPPSISSTLSSHSADPRPPPVSIPLPPPPPPQPQSASLEALKTSDHLSRRASKRYSAYAIQKMTSPVPSSSGSGGLSPGGGDTGEGGTSPRTDKIKGRDFASPTFAGVGGADVRRSKSEHRVSTRPNGSGLGRGVPPVPGIPRSWSSQQNLRGGGGGGPGGSPIVEEEEEGEGGSPAFSRSPPSFPPPAVPSTSNEVPRSGSAPTLSSSHSASSASLAPGPAYPPHLGISRSPSPALPPLPVDQSPPLPFHAAPIPASTSSATTTTTPRAPPPHSPSPPPSATAPSFPCPIFLRIGPSVRKATLSAPPNDVQDLRQLFVERFGYHPGIEGWPEVYVQDEKTGVRYELEEMEDVVEGCVLSLNVDAVEQVKHHIDSGLSSLAQDIKELRATVTAMRRLSIPPVHAVSAAHLSPNAASDFNEERGMRPSPSQKQFEQAAQNVLRMRRLNSTASLAVPQEEGGEEAKEGVEMKEDETKDGDEAKPPPTTTATEPFSPTAATSLAPIVDTLKSQHAEVTNLRREIGVLRQVYVDFTSQTKSMFASIRVQTSHLHGLAQSKLSTDRAFVEAGTAKLDSESTDLVVRVDELQDTIEQLRADLVDRGVKPRPQQLSETASALRRAMEQRVKLDAWLKEVKPSWSQMWSDELSKILGEQKAVETQQTLLGELEEDLADCDGVLRRIQGAAKHLRSSASSSASSASPAGGPNGTALRPVRRDYGGAVDPSEGLSTVFMEVRALQPDPAKRLEAIARAEKEREKNLASRTDEFAEELGDFVGRGKLKKSGGIEEAERLRQKRSEMTLKAMFQSQ